MSTSAEVISSGWLALVILGGIFLLTWLLVWLGIKTGIIKGDPFGE